jgi:hypothetical protein
VQFITNSDFCQARNLISGKNGGEMLLCLFEVLKEALSEVLGEPLRKAL